MGHIEYSKDLQAAPEALYTVVSDPNTWGDWFTIHERWLEEPPTAVTVGSKLVAKIVMLGMANKMEWSVEELDAPNSLVLSGAGMAGVKVRFSFDITENTSGGTTFKVAGDFEGALIKGALGKAVEKDTGKHLEKSLDQLDALASAA
ncbi:type II toxin-antitoxin system Rv0910 family toxin [Nocardia sp. SSK8]|uniref:type II toxin-antitoxin system Rv0910 family toxin n=1 Tax=Nocardia sp. SSK8 TaxID=3120154 RepID=UPI0030085D25